MAEEKVGGANALREIVRLRAIVRLNQIQAIEYRSMPLQIRLKKLAIEELLLCLVDYSSVVARDEAELEEIVSSVGRGDWS